MSTLNLFAKMNTLNYSTLNYSLHRPIVHWAPAKNCLSTVKTLTVSLLTFYLNVHWILKLRFELLKWPSYSLKCPKYIPAVHGWRARWRVYIFDQRTTQLNKIKPDFYCCRFYLDIRFDYMLYLTGAWLFVMPSVTPPPHSTHPPLSIKSTYRVLLIDVALWQGRQFLQKMR